MISDFNVWSYWNSTIKWSHPTISDAYKEFGHTEVSGDKSWTCSLYTSWLYIAIIQYKKLSVKTNTSEAFYFFP